VPEEPVVIEPDLPVVEPVPIPEEPVVVPTPEPTPSEEPTKEEPITSSQQKFL
jgi:hypothetical protein